MAVRYERGSTYFPGYTTGDSKIEFIEAEEVARLSLKNRREITLLEDPSVMTVAKILAERVQKPGLWIRNAVTTIDRFAREVCDGDLPSALGHGKKDLVYAEFLLQKYIGLHEDLTQLQITSLLFGPKLWWTFNGVDVVWENAFTARSKTHIANSTNGDFDPTARLLMLSLVGTGLTFDEIETIKVKDAGSLDINGKLVPNFKSSPLTIEFDGDDGRKITFLGEEARMALISTIIDRNPGPEDLLFAEPDQISKFREIAEERGRATIETVNQVNVVLCKVVGDFFLGWGIPGRNFFKENGLPNPHEKTMDPFVD
jgi:hypothetical protein